MSHNNQKKIAVINDLSGFGRCSLSVAMPIISYLGIQCCPVPTSIFSNHTGFPQFFFDDYTEKMEEYLDYWKKLNLEFEGILSGFLGSKRQISIVRNFIEEFRNENTKVIIDPAMGENGKAYSTFTDEMCHEMKKLIEYADIITPNLTECCILTDRPYKHFGWSEEELFAMSEKLILLGSQKVVISGIDLGDLVGNVICEKGCKPKMLSHQKSGDFRSGTGDIYASIIAADAVNEISLEKSVQKAGEFVRKAIVETERLRIPSTDGLAFEEILYTLERKA